MDESSRRAKIRILESVFLLKKIDHVEDDFSFYVVKFCLILNILRKSTETGHMNFFLKLDIPIMNKRILKIEYMKTDVIIGLVSRM
ncbi:hypothetical protein BpHYR1_038160 [Brachionus plicatilis]|uniref:Uncharacterized protein n=1 Tax=Brachionus plicatilis TaxID=10195 RepID=A0A3M7Q3F1_BRAPC|nr:hypothetical protein BpHYR1_038160 [Brachionus plicatilis]